MKMWVKRAARLMVHRRVTATDVSVDRANPSFAAGALLMQQEYQGLGPVSS